MADNCAAASLFGWDFQVNAAIAIMIDNISDIEEIRLEGKKQDIEITLSNNEKIFAQAKSVEKPGDYSNVKKHLTEALNSLNNTADESGNIAKQFIYITNTENPLGNYRTISQFMGPYIRQKYSDLSEDAKKIIDSALSKADKTLKIDKEKLYIHILHFQNGVSERDRYTNIKRIVDEFVETIVENRNGLGGKILDIWQKELLLNGSTSNTNLTLNKQQFTWIVVVQAIDNSLEDNSLYSKFDISEVQAVKTHFKETINNLTVKFEFVTKVLADFNEYSPSVRKNKTVEFVEQCWANYILEFSLENLSADTK